MVLGLMRTAGRSIGASAWAGLTNEPAAALHLS